MAQSRVTSHGTRRWTTTGFHLSRRKNSLPPSISRGEKVSSLQLTFESPLFSRKQIARRKRFRSKPGYPAPRIGLENRESSHRSGKLSPGRLPLSSVSYTLQPHRARDHTLHR